MGISLKTYIFGRIKLALGVPQFTPKYQAVLDYAIANSIPIPSNEQNIRNNQIALNLVNEGVLDNNNLNDKLDLFYYFKQPSGLEEFVTLNWVNPAKHRLNQTNPDFKPAFIPNKGVAKIIGSQFYNPNYIPSRDAIAVKNNNVSAFFKSFDIEEDYTTAATIFGGRVNALSGDQILIQRINNDVILFRGFDSASDGTATGFGKENINSHFHFNKVGLNPIFFKDNFLKNGTVLSNGNLTTVEQYLLGFNINEVNVGTGLGGLEYFGLGASLEYNQKEIYDILNGTYSNNKVNSVGSFVFDTTTVSSQSIYWVRMYRSIDFPTVTTSKNYIVLWSTDHAEPSSTGRVCWGECDSPNLAGFQENGAIVTNYRSETPELVYRPNNSHYTDKLFLYYHPTQDHPDSGGYQQTRLITTTGGVLHTATWTDRGKVLGITAFETANFVQIHTGYFLNYIQQNGTSLGFHAVRGIEGSNVEGIPRWGISTSPEGVTWTRTNQHVDTSSYLPYKTQLDAGHSLFFNRGARQFCVGSRVAFDFNFALTARIGLFLCDGNYQPTVHLGNLSIPDGGNLATNFSFYVEGEVLHVYYVMSKTALYHTSFDLADRFITLPTISDLAVQDVYGTAIRLNWTPTISKNGIKFYKIFVDDVLYETTDNNLIPQLITGLINNQIYSFEIIAVDQFLNESPVSNLITQQINGNNIDAVTDLEVETIYASAIKLKWTEPFSINKISYYKLFVGGVYQKDFTDTTGYALNLNSSTLYEITIKAVDVNGEISELSNIVSSTTNATEPYPVSNIVSYYKIQGTAKDSFNTNNGVATGVTYEQGTIKLRGAFNGTTSKVDCGNAASLQINSGSLVTVIKTSNVGTGFRGLFSKDKSYSIICNAGVIGTYSFAGSVGFRSTGVNINDNVERVVALTFNSGVTNGTKMYINGVLVLTTTITMNAQTENLFLGQNASTQRANAKIDDSAVFNTILTAAQVSEITSKLQSGQSLI